MAKRNRTTHTSSSSRGTSTAMSPSPVSSSPLSPDLRSALGRTSRRLLRDQRGLSTVEYIIILAFIAVSGITLWQTFGNKILGKLDESNSAVDGVQTTYQGGGGGDTP